VIRRAILLAAIAAGAAGCGPRFDHLDFDTTTNPPLPVSLSSHHVGIPEGIAVGVDVTPMDDSNAPLDRDVPVALTSSDASVFDVTLQSESSDRKDPNRSYVIFGVAPGSALLHVEVDGDRGADIPVTVAAQQ
jgi:hypothetical protein